MFTTDPDAEFAALVQRQSRFVFRVAYAVLLNAHDAEDAVQETFLKLYRNRGWQRAENERAFLARTAWRIAVDLRPHTQRPIQIDADDEAHEVPSSVPGPDQQALSADQNARIHNLIDTLPEELRVPLVLASFQELTSRDIAATLGVPEGTVRTRLQRARLLLREKLTRLDTPIQEVRHA
ncbi:MAG: sigma-70 family RNA polymerase sigma factor [Terracidiphilus sp.]|nr:sigma-70 family RNA polymerase sigma factor [Terracidiphilus sp.]